MPKIIKKFKSIPRGLLEDKRLKKEKARDYLGEKNPFYGKHHTETTKKKISEAKKGKHHSLKTRKKMSESHKGEKNSFYGKTHTKESRKKMSLSLLGRKSWNKGTKGIVKANCGSFKKGQLSWSKLHPELMPRGKEHHNWKGGITPLNQKIRNQSIEYKKWRDVVYKKNYWTCFLCGKKCKKKDIIAHHLLSFSDYSQYRFEQNNGIVLCRSCHCKLHKKLKKQIYEKVS